jgi:hypothetical protein
MSEKKGIEGIEKILQVGNELFDSISDHQARNVPWGTWDFIQDVGPELASAVGSFPDVPAEVADLSKDELITLVADLAGVVQKAILCIVREKK